MPALLGLLCQRLSLKVLLRLRRWALWKRPQASGLLVALELEPLLDLGLVRLRDCQMLA